MSNTRRQRLKPGVPYRLEGLGYDGDTLVCGLCGKHYRSLSTHIRRSHEWSLYDYREEFGLNRTQPLWVPELSQRQGENLRRRGLVGTNLRYDMFLLDKELNFGIQARYEQSCGGKGKVMTMTPAKIMAQKNNQTKTQVLSMLYTCAICGREYFGRVCDKNRQSHYCSECKAKGREMAIKQWRASHPEKAREYARRHRERKVC